MVKRRKIIWPAFAKQQLRQMYDHIRKDSPKNALKVRNAIVAATLELPEHPNMHPADKYRTSNENGEFRAFELFHYRIAYQVTKESITIVRVRHTSMEPLSY